MNPAVAMLYLLWGCAFFLYWWLFDGVLPQRATIGKRAMEIRVVRTDGRPFEGAGAFGRGLAHWLSFALLGLGYWWAWSNPAQETWHDKIAGTAVVDVRTEVPTTERPDRRESDVSRGTLGAWSTHRPSTSREFYMWCPSCCAEYGSDFTQCADCLVALVAEYV